ncbi:MAG: flagellar basal body rod protein FlgB [Candidatus Nitrospinota bacterium M3_3B_026]
MGLVSDLLFTNKVGRLVSKAMDIHAQRALLVNSNIANVETPGYKAVDLEPFENRLKEAYKPGIGVKTTDPRHLDGADGGLEGFKPKVGVSQDAPRLDGNNVNLDREMAKLLETSLTYQTLIAVRGKRGGIIDEAIERSL